MIAIYDCTDDDTKMQVASIMHSNEPSITFKVQPTQFQRVSDDCGLDAVAYATDLAHGNDPASLMYTQKDLRDHFWNCVQKS